MTTYATAPGILTRAEYDALPGENWSLLKMMQRSPMHYKFTKEQGFQPMTDPIILGVVTHYATFEPEKLDTHVAVWGEKRNSNAWRAFEEENANKTIILVDAFEHAKQIAAVARKVAGKLLSNLDNEVTIQWTHKNGLPGKGRIDHMSRGYGIIDLKTCRDASPLGFGRSAASLGYHCQAAYYVDGYEAMTGVRLPYTILAVENRAPFAAALYTVTPDHLELGRSIYLPLLDRVKECQERGEWPAYWAGVLSLPKWATAEPEGLDGLGLTMDGEDI
jgi:exodeoxyribonuclease VIII